MCLSAKSSGVTTTAVARGEAALMELDPAGGDVSLCTGTFMSAGLIDVARELRQPNSLPALERHLSAVPPGVSTLLAPSSGPMAASVIRSVVPRLSETVRRFPGPVVIDAGRWDPTQPTARRVGCGALTVVVCRAELTDVEHTRHLLAPLVEMAPAPICVVVVGDVPQPPTEVAKHLGVPLAGVMAWDPRAVSALWAAGATRSWSRGRLARSATATLAHVMELTPTATATPATRLA